MPKVAYLITSISYNYIHNLKGTIEEDELYQFMLNEVSEYIINNSRSLKFETVEDVHNFWNKYDGYYVWDAYYVKNDDWINIKPLDENILTSIQNLMQYSSINVKDEFNERNSIKLLDKNKNIDMKENICDTNDLTINWNLVVDEEIDWID
jgi:hypothetical protein